MHCVLGVYPKERGVNNSQEYCIAYNVCHSILWLLGETLAFYKGQSRLLANILYSMNIMCRQSVMCVFIQQSTQLCTPDPYTICATHYS